MELNKIYLGHTPNIIKAFPDESIDCGVTSPPYWALRNYEVEPQVWDGKENCVHEWGEDLIISNSGGGWNKPETRKNYPPFRLKNPEKERPREVNKGSFCNKCGAWKGSLGLEPTFELYLKHLWDIFDGFKRVLKKTGTLWVNIGDVYNNVTPGSRNVERWPKQSRNNHQPSKPKIVYPKKSLCLIPERFAIGMVDRGWICRNVIIWHKSNVMPGSAKDRFTVDYEPVFLFVKNQKYYFETQREPANYDGRKDTRMKGSWKYQTSVIPGKKEHSMALQGHERWTRGPHGEYLRLKRSVWKIPNARTTDAHFAIFPEALIEPMIKAGCPEFVCKKCGKAREKILKPTEHYKQFLGKGNLKEHHAGQETHEKFSVKVNAEYECKGYTDCGCGAGFEPGIVVDLFSGRGTTAVVAKELGRNYIGIDLSAKYIEMTEKWLLDKFGMFKYVSLRR